jgi:hypothetical protein
VLCVYFRGGAGGAVPRHAFVRRCVPLSVLKQLDGVMGGLLGFLRGGLLLFVLFMLVPVMLAFLPFEELQIILSESQLATFFYKGNFMIDLIRGLIGG